MAPPKGTIPWNKGKIGVQPHSEATRLKMSKTRKGMKKSPLWIAKHSGANHHGWKGDDVGYWALHDYIERLKPRPDCCEKCEKPHRRLYLHNKDHLYSRNPDDYIYLCPKCHAKAEKELKERKNAK